MKINFTFDKFFGLTITYTVAFNYLNKNEILHFCIVLFNKTFKRY